MRQAAVSSRTQASENGSPGYARAIALKDLEPDRGAVVRLEGRTIALFLHGNQVYAVDNRCPHMGFPLHKGTVSGGILTCHWHHAR
ncbi:MAG TPA: Rieske 2Fe-2S domain-containing protein, partial [Chthonomonadales bacterium]|nr:Rieske 2Fe-2S domain-containing protein [Chthonomonadales bacterium]